MMINDVRKSMTDAAILFAHIQMTKIGLYRT